MKKTVTYEAEVPLRLWLCVHHDVRDVVTMHLGEGPASTPDARRMLRRLALTLHSLCAARGLAHSSCRFDGKVARSLTMPCADMSRVASLVKRALDSDEWYEWWSIVEQTLAHKVGVVTLNANWEN